MQVEPHRLVELAASSEAICEAMLQDWDDARDELAAACASLGDATGLLNLSSAYGDALLEAGEVVGAVTQSLSLGVEGLVAAADDATKADETVAVEMGRSGHRVDGAGHGRGHGRGHGGR